MSSRCRQDYHFDLDERSGNPAVQHRECCQSPRLLPRVTVSRNPAEPGHFHGGSACRGVFGAGDLEIRNDAIMTRTTHAHLTIVLPPMICIRALFALFPIFTIHFDRAVVWCFVSCGRNKHGNTAVLSYYGGPY